MKERACSLVPGIEVRSHDRPATMRDPWSFMKVHLVEGSAAAAPMVGRPTKKAQTRGFQSRTPGHSDGFALIQGLCLRLKLKSAALEDTDPVTRSDQRYRHRYAGSSGADDADISINRRTIGEFPEIDQHGVRSARQVHKREPRFVPRPNRRYG
jgi:hypothetical protein